MREIFTPSCGSIWDCYLENSFTDGLLVFLVGNAQAERKEKFCILVRGDK